MSEPNRALDPSPAGEGTPEASASELGRLRLGVVGTGVMAQAIVGGLLSRGLVSAALTVCSHPRAARREQLRSELGVEVTADNGAAVRVADVVLLAVKPQILPRVMPEMAPSLSENTLVVSVVAGASTRVLARGLRHPALVRAMPNTPAQIGAGITVWYSTAEVDPAGKRRARLLLSALGDQLQVEDEQQVAMATAISGTGPTYTFLFAEALIDAAVHLGFPRQIARRLVLTTVAGSVSFATQSQQHVSQLRDMVTSPGGTSAEALAALERGGFRTVLSDAVWAAYRRTLQLESTLEEKTSPPPPQG